MVAGLLITLKFQKLVIAMMAAQQMALNPSRNLAGQYVNYTVTFINEKEVGNKKGAKTNYKVITVDPFNVTEEDALTLRQLFKDGKNYMITSYAAPADDKNPVDFSYEVNLKEKSPKKNIKANKPEMTRNNVMIRAFFIEWNKKMTPAIHWSHLLVHIQHFT